MTERFTKFIRGFVFPHECVYKKGHWGDLNYVTWENVSGDAGGLTKWGIDQRSHPKLDIKALSQEQAEQIYWDEYWTRGKAEEMPPKWGEVIADIRINGGNGPEMAQRALVGLGEDIRVDGVIGPATRDAMQRQGDNGVRSLINQRDVRYHKLAEKPSQKKFLEGWLNRDKDLRKHLGL